MKFRKNSLRFLLCSAAAALSLVAVPAAAEQDKPQLTVTFISDAAQGRIISHKKYDRAIERLEDTEAEGIRGFYAANNLCVSYLKVGDVEKAQYSCDAAVTRIEQLMKKTYSRATAHRQAHEYRRLLAVALSNRGVVNYVNDNVEMARNDFEAAIETGSGIREAQFNLARLSETESA